MRLAKAPFVTVDTEFMRESTFWARLCLIQMAGPDEAAIIDPLAEGIDLAPFYGLMADERVCKVFHAARQDIEIFVKQAGAVPHPIFDTQIAAMVCGYGDQVSYDQLVSRITGDQIDKSSASPTGRTGRFPRSRSPTRSPTSRIFATSIFRSPRSSPSRTG